MSQYLRKYLLAAFLILPTPAWATVYSLSHMPNVTRMAAAVTPGQDADDIQPDNMTSVLHLFRTGDGWSNGSQARKQATGKCDWDLGRGCSFNDARDCQIAAGGTWNTCHFELMVNGTYTTVNPNTGLQSCNSDTAQDNTECKHNVEKVTVNWGDGTTTVATYAHSPNNNEYDPTNVPMYIARHTYSSLSDGHAGTYSITVTENVGGTWKEDCILKKVRVPIQVCGLSVVSGSAGWDYCQKPGGNWTLGGGEWWHGPCPSGENLLNCPQEYLGPNQIRIGPGWCYAFTWPGNFPKTINGGPADFCHGNKHSDCGYDVIAENQCTTEYIWKEKKFCTPVLVGGQDETQTAQVYVYHDTPPPVQSGVENAAPTPSTIAEEPE